MLKIMRTSTYQREIECAYNRGIRKLIEDIRFILDLPDGKLYTKEVTLRGDNQTIEHCLFLGCKTGITVEPDVTVKIEGNVLDDCS